MLHKPLKVFVIAQPRLFRSALGNASSWECRRWATRVSPAASQQPRAHATQGWPWEHGGIFSSSHPPPPDIYECVCEFTKETTLHAYLMYLGKLFSLSCPLSEDFYPCSFQKAPLHPQDLCTCCPFCLEHASCLLWLSELLPSSQVGCCLL